MTQKSILVSRPSVSLPFLLLLFLNLVLTAPNPASALAEKDLNELVQPTGSRVDLAETALKVSQDWDPSVDTAAYRNTLDALTEKIKKKIAGSTSAQHIISAFQTVIYQEEGYDYTDQVDPQGIPLNPAELFMHGLLTTKKGYCMTLSMLYLIVADRLDLPFYGVALPNHFFVRYQSGNTQINVETTQRGEILPDDFYRQRFGVPESKDSHSFFMRNLDHRKTLGAYFSNVGMAWYKKGNGQKAVAYLRVSSQVNPASLEVHNNLGNILSEQNDHDSAIAEYKAALTHNPNSLATLVNLGLTQVEAEKLDDAIESFLQVVQLDPGYEPAHAQLARLFLFRKRYYAALLHLDRLIAMGQGGLEIYLNRVTVFLETGNFPMASLALKQASDRFPNHPALHDKLAEIYYKMEDFEKAIFQYRFLIENNPDNLKAYVQLGWTHYRNGNLKMAITWTRRGMTRVNDDNPYKVLGEMNLGFYYVIDNDYEKAEQWYRKVLDRKNPGALASLLSDLEDARKTHPDRADLDYFAGWVLHESGQKEKAQLRLQDFLKHSPSGPLADKARDLLTQMGVSPEREPAPTAPPQHSQEKSSAGDMVEIPAGEFIMGSDNHGEDERPEHRVFLDAFRIDLYEVSAEQYAEFLNTVGNKNKYYYDSKFGTLIFDGKTFKARKGLERFPINSVSWHGAEAYCQWKGKRLPTEAEWEKAARGPDGNIYPWGPSRPTPAQARFRQSWTEELKHGVMVPVDAMPEGKSFYGLHHMAGNVKEWVDDWHDREYYQEKEHRSNPPGPIGGEFKVLRGGSWRDLAGFLYSSFRNNAYPNNRLDDYGFRCAQGKKREPRPPKRKFIRQPGDFPPDKKSRSIQFFR